MIGMDENTGRAISGRPYLTQSLSDIINTPIGTRLERRNYGSLIPEMIDQPSTPANVIRLYAATAYALLLWAPYFRLSSVQLQVAMDGSAELDLDGVADGKNLQIRIPVKGAQ